MVKLFRISTVPISLNILLKGQLKFLNGYFNVTAVSGNGEDLQEVSEREKVRVVALEMERKISPVKDFISLLKMYFFLKKEKPIIVHSITPKAGLISMLAAKFAGVPIRMHTFTGLIFPSKTGILQKILIVMDRLLCSAATNIYPEGEGVKNDLLKYKITDKLLKVLGNGNVNGIDTAFFDPEQVSSEAKEKLRRELNIADADTVFVYVGRLVKDKGINELIEAFSKLENNNSKLLLVGPFEQELDPLLPETLSQINSNKNIITVGFQKDVRDYLAISNVFVFPSYREGFPNVVLQAGAMGLSCIVTDISGSNEIIIHGKNGYIISAKSSDELYHAMNLAETNPEMFFTFAKNSRNLICDRYNQYFVWQSLKNEYDLLLKNRAIL